MMDGNGLSLVVDHLGPIEHADISLNPLTILIGRNNTGKTYAAQTLYAARQALLSSPPALVDELGPDERLALDEIVRLRGRRSLGSGEEDQLYVPPALVGPLSRAVSASLEQAGRELELRLQASFGVDGLRQITSWKSREVLGVEIRKTEVNGPGYALFGTRGSSAPVAPTLRGSPIKWPDIDNFLPLRGLFDDDAAGERHDEMLTQVMWFLGRELWRSYMNGLGLAGAPHYLPAGRSGLLNAWTDVVKLRIQLERDRYGLPSIPEPSLDGVALDFISSLADVFGSGSRGMRMHGRLGSRIASESGSSFAGVRDLLQSLMEGRVTAESRRDLVPTLAYEQSGQSIAIRHASSMVADLAPLAIWIDRLLVPNDLLIVDEPESHLHPEAIRVVARVLVRLVNSGVRVVCPTHSSVLLHEISNCVLRGALQQVPPEDSADGYSAADCLSVQDLAVHQFVRPTKNGPVYVERLRVDPEWGIPEDEYVKVAADLSDDSARLVALLK